MPPQPEAQKVCELCDPQDIEEYCQKRDLNCPVHSCRGAQHLITGARFQARDVKWIVSDPWKKENLLDSLWQLAMNNRSLIPKHHFDLLMLFCKDAKG